MPLHSCHLYSLGLSFLRSIASTRPYTNRRSRQTNATACAPGFFLGNRRWSAKSGKEEEIYARRCPRSQMARCTDVAPE
jgi:hypothetical protein